MKKFRLELQRGVFLAAGDPDDPVDIKRLDNILAKVISSDTISPLEFETVTSLLKCKKYFELYQQFHKEGDNVSYGALRARAARGKRKIIERIREIYKNIEEEDYKFE